MNQTLSRARWWRVWPMAICPLISGNLSADTGAVPGWQFHSAGQERCRLSSAKTTMFDGYQETIIQLHVTPERVYLHSKAVIDAEFADNGLEVVVDSPAARRQLAQAGDALATYSGYAGLDMVALEAEIRPASAERDAVRSHKWFQDYKRNPVNAARLDQELASAEERLATLEAQRDGLRAYAAALQAQTQAEAALSRLPRFPLVTSNRVEQRKTLIFNQPRNELLDAFRQGSAIRVQLRFWPTWPATGTHEARLSLGGFNEALGQLQSCIGQG